MIQLQDHNYALSKQIEQLEEEKIVLRKKIINSTMTHRYND